MKAGSERNTSKWPAFVLLHMNFQNRTSLRSTAIMFAASVPFICCFKKTGSASFKGRSTQAAEPRGIRPYVLGVPAATGDLPNRTVRVSPSCVAVTPRPPLTISGKNPGGSMDISIFALCYSACPLHRQATGGRVQGQGFVLLGRASVNDGLIDTGHPRGGPPGKGKLRVFDSCRTKPGGPL